MYDTSFWMLSSIFMYPLFLHRTLKFYLVLVTTRANIYTMTFSDLHVFFYKQSKFWKQARAWLWKKLVQAQSMLALCLFIKILLDVCLWKRLDQARNMIILEKLLYKMCCCCDTDYNIIGHLASSERHLFCCIFDKSGRKCFAILHRKNHIQYGKIHVTQKNT